MKEYEVEYISLIKRMRKGGKKRAPMNGNKSKYSTQG
jgi:hypothetical protein